MNILATFRKRGTSWRVELSINGNRTSATFDTKAQAKEWASSKEVEIRQGATTKSKNTVLDAINRYSETVSAFKKGAKWEQLRLNKFIRTMDFIDKRIVDVNTDDIATWRDQQCKVLSDGSVRREMTIMRSVFELARKEWGWINSNPMDDVKKPKNPKHRDRRLSDAEICSILAQLRYADDQPIILKNQQVAVAFLLCIETAMRAGELMGLQWANVHLNERFVTLLDTKNGDKRNVPLSTRAVELFKKMIGVDADAVFTVKSDSLSTLFRKARDKANIKDLHFHDTRHEACTRLAKKLQVLDLARMIGHRDLKSLMIYYNATAGEIALQLD